MRATRMLCLGLLAALATKTAGAAELTVMSFNIWGGGANEGKPVDETVAVIRAAGADIVGLQETRLESDPCTAEVCPPAGSSVAPTIAAALGWHLYEQTAANDALWANAVISRYPILGATPNDLGVTIDIDGRKVGLFNLHLDDSPYQPYQLLGIEYGPFPFLATEAEAIAAARATRGPAIELFKADLATVAADVLFVTGDFNEPSFRDWTTAAVAAGRQPLAVRFPTTSAVEELGFTDTFRAVFPDEVAKPGFTWTPTTSDNDAEDHHDRIDFVFARAAGLLVLRSAIVGEAAPASDLVVTPWPSDHRAVVSTVRF